MVFDRTGDSVVYAVLLLGFIPLEQRMVTIFAILVFISQVAATLVVLPLGVA